MNDRNKYEKAKELLLKLQEKTEEAIIAIEADKPDWQICNLAIEEVEQLTEEISLAILGDSTTFTKDIDAGV